MDLLPADIPLKDPEINPIPLNVNAFLTGNGIPNPSLVISIGVYASKVLEILKDLVDFDGTTSSHITVSSDPSVQRSLERVFVSSGSVHRGSFATNLNTANDFINSLNTIIHTSNWNGVSRLDVVLMVALDEPLAQMTSEIIQILQMKLHEFHPSITGIFGIHADGDANTPRIKPVEAALIRELFRLSKGQPQLLSPVTYISNSDVISKEILGRIVLLNIGEGGVSEINAAMAALMFIPSCGWKSSAGNGPIGTNIEQPGYSRPGCQTNGRTCILSGTSNRYSTGMRNFTEIPAGQDGGYYPGWLHA